jgi:hypothetical protein
MQMPQIPYQGKRQIEKPKFELDIGSIFPKMKTLLD